MRELIKSGGALTWAWAAVKFVPVARLMRKLPVRGFAEPAQGSEIDSIGRALDAWSRRLPLRTLCFERGLAAYWMLHWRRRQATLFYGAAVIDGVLKAHVWVRSGDRDVIGCENAAEFAILSQFSNDSSSSSVQP
jgi:hypothetical protein